jgi:MFS family permease
MRIERNLKLIYSAALLRSLGIGLLSVVLGVYLARGGLSSLQIGLVIGSGLAGAALGTAAMSFFGDRFGRRRTLIVLSLLSVIGGIGLAFVHKPIALIVVAFVGMLNGMGADRTAAFALEQAVIPEAVPASQRTWALSGYNLVLDIGHAFGALCAAVPVLLQQWMFVDLASAYQAVFLGYAVLQLSAAAIYVWMSPEIEVATVATLIGTRLQPVSRRVVTRLAALFSLDSFGGGLLTDALIAYWFFRQFGIAEQELGVLFFAVHILNAVSYLLAAYLAQRFGLLNTMVFTHLPSSILLIMVPLAPSFTIAVVLFLLREALVEMDVPTRQAYVLALVQPQERTFASGITNLTRNISWAGASSVAGALMEYLGFSAPLFIGGGAKIAYDLLLYGSFRKVSPSGERTNSDLGLRQPTAAR